MSEQKSDGKITFEKMKVRCPACGEIMEALVKDGEAKGYCAVARKTVEAQIVISG